MVNILRIIKKNCRFIRNHYLTSDLKARDQFKLFELKILGHNISSIFGGLVKIF